MTPSAYILPDPFRIIFCIKDDCLSQHAINQAGLLWTINNIISRPMADQLNEEFEVRTFR